MVDDWQVIKNPYQNSLIGSKTNLFKQMLVTKPTTF
jgi:hypothetical protein